MERRPVEEAGKMTTWYKLQADKGEIFDWETISSSWKSLEGEEMGNFVPQHGPAAGLNHPWISFLELVVSEWEVSTYNQEMSLDRLSRSMMGVFFFFFFE